MDWNIVVLVAVVGVLLVGGRLVVTQKGLTLNTDGFMRNWARVNQQKSPESPSSAEAKPRPTSRLAQQLGRKLPLGSIVWVDDHPLNNVLERAAFANIGIFCDSYSCNPDAIAAMRTIQYDLVISDIRRDNSGDDGWELLQQVRAIQPNIPFVYYTSSVDDQRRTRALAAGAQAIVRLPDELYNVVVSQLTGSVRPTS